MSHVLAIPYGGTVQLTRVVHGGGGLLSPGMDEGRDWQSRLMIGEIIRMALS